MQISTQSLIRPYALALTMLAGDACRSRQEPSAPPAPQAQNFNPRISRNTIITGQPVRRGDVEVMRRLQQIPANQLVNLGTTTAEVVFTGTEEAAIAQLLDQARDKQVVLVGESHTQANYQGVQPQVVFIRSFLPAFYEAGFHDVVSEHYPLNYLDIHNTDVTIEGRAPDLNVYVDNFPQAESRPLYAELSLTRASELHFHGGMVPYDLAVQLSRQLSQDPNNVAVQDMALRGVRVATNTALSSLVRERKQTIAYNGSLHAYSFQLFPTAPQLAYISSDLQRNGTTFMSINIFMPGVNTFVLAQSGNEAWESPNILTQELELIQRVQGIPMSGQVRLVKFSSVSGVVQYYLVYPFEN